jgi:hypothetical protein
MNSTTVQMTSQEMADLQAFCLANPENDFMADVLSKFVRPRQGRISEKQYEAVVRTLKKSGGARGMATSGHTLIKSTSAQPAISTSTPQPTEVVTTPTLAPGVTTAELFAAAAFIAVSLKKPELSAEETYRTAWTLARAMLAQRDGGES